MAKAGREAHEALARAEAERQAALAEAHRRFVIEQELQRLQAARRRNRTAGTTT